MSISTQTCEKGSHDFQGSGKCVRCGYQFRCTCGRLIRQDDLTKHLKKCQVASRSTRRLSLIDLRADAGLSQQELADKTGLHISTIYRMENGRTPALGTCLRIAEVLSKELGDTVMVEDVMRK